MKELSKILASDQFWKAVTALAWPAILVVVLALFRRDLRLLIRHIVWRIKAGAAIKVASFEVGAPFVSHDEKRNSVRGVAGILDDPDGDFAKSRDVFKTTNRNLFLVHRLLPSTDESQLYDVMIYVVPSLKYGSLEGVLSVEYYFGRHWGSKVFKSIDRDGLFNCNRRMGTFYLHGEDSLY